jgi:hypothetical protein
MALCCLEQQHRFRRLRADFLGYMIREGRLEQFASQVERYRRFFYYDSAGRQNDSRIASKLAMLAAAFCEFGGYLVPDWPGWTDEVNEFVEADLVALSNGILLSVEGQQPSEIFLDELKTLIGTKAVRITSTLCG